MSHVQRVFREQEWPFQWIGMCSCRRGIRCNSEERAREFMAKCGESGEDKK